MKVEFVKCGDVETERFLNCKKFFELEGYEVTVEIDLKRSMTLSRGHINPATGFIFIFDDHIGFNMFDATSFIEKFGFRQI